MSELPGRSVFPRTAYQYPVEGEGEPGPLSTWTSGSSSWTTPEDATRRSRRFGTSRMSGLSHLRSISATNGPSSTGSECSCQMWRIRISSSPWIPTVRTGQRTYRRCLNPCWMFRQRGSPFPWPAGPSAASRCSSRCCIRCSERCSACSPVPLCGAGTLPLTGMVGETNAPAPPFRPLLLVDTCQPWVRHRLCSVPEG